MLRRVDATDSQQPAAYAPTSRRPIADSFRATARAAVRGCVRHGVSADAVSYASIVASAGAGGMFLVSGRAPWLLLVAPGLCYARLWFNMLDGMVAIAAGTASRRGEILNELPDRLSDVLVFAGVAHSGLAHPAAGWGAAVAALLTAYVGTLGQAVAGRREYGGAMSKPWRMVTLQLGAAVAFGLIARRGSSVFPGGWTALDATCGIVMIGCVQTCAVRLRATLRLLRGTS